VTASEQNRSSERRHVGSSFHQRDAGHGL
jgi:hypothetical protein